MPLKNLDIGPIHLEFTPDNKNINSIETKQITDGVTTGSMAQIFSGANEGWGAYLSPPTAYMLYELSDTIRDCVDRISDSFVELPIILQDLKTKTHLDDHPALSLFRKTDLRMNEGQLKKEMMVSLLLTNEAYPVLEGYVKAEPAGLFHYPAYAVNDSQGTDGYIQQIFAAYQNVIQTFHRNIKDINPKFNTYTFQTENQLSEMMQVIRIRRRNYLRGSSPIEPIFYQALAKYYGTIHDYSLIRNGARPGVIVSPKDAVLTPDQMKEFATEWRNGQESLRGRGSTVIANRPIDLKELIVNNRDMDWNNLIKEFRQEIYAMYKIPLPMVVSDTMTLNNYQFAIEFYYDEAVLPNSRYLLKNVGDFILSRYPGGDKLEFCIDERELPALKDRLFRRANLMRTAGIYSQDQILQETGYPKLEDKDEGETILIQTSLTSFSVTDDEEYTPEEPSAGVEVPNSQTTEDIIEEIRSTSAGTGKINPNIKPKGGDNLGTKPKPSEAEKKK